MKPKKIEVTGEEKEVLEAMLDSAVPVPPGGAMICIMKEETDPKKRREYEHIKNIADLLRFKGFFIGEGNTYLPTTIAYKIIKRQAQAPSPASA